MGGTGQHNPDYLAKDYQSFRALLLDHLAARAPGSAPFEVASVESTLVETLAYVGDYLSYFQDAVATEAYLGTARRRISLRRHARLVDYVPNEGCSARLWARIEVAADSVTLPAGTRMTTAIDKVAEVRIPAGYATDEREVFETMHEARLARAHNSMLLAAPRTLAPGATSARLAGLLPRLEPGDVLVLRHPASGWAHALRLTRVSPDAGAGETGIDWHADDALPLQIPRGRYEVLGNIVLADHGRSDERPLPPVRGEGACEAAISCPELSFVVPYLDDDARGGSAAAAMRLDPVDAQPAIALAEHAAFLDDKALARRPQWQGCRDLVHASQFDRAFAVEPESDGTVNLRFGDGVHGRRLQSDWDYRVRYRSGTGIRGNIGPNTLAHVVSDDERILAVGNPLAARGGCDPESLADIRARAPVAAEAQRRAVTDEDYVRMTCLFPGVSAAFARRAWLPAGRLVTIHVCRDGDHPWDPFEKRLGEWLGRFALVGDLVKLLPAERVVPEIVFALEIEGGRPRDEVEAVVRAHLAAMRYGFGETLDPQDLVARAGEVAGVVRARVLRMAPAGTPPSPLPPTPIEVRATEIVRLDPSRIDLRPVPAR